MDNPTRLADGCHELAAEHIEEVKQMMADGFLMNNQVWSSFNISKQQILEFFDRVLKSHLNSQQRSKQAYGQHVNYNHVYARNGKIVSSVIHYELEDYKQIQKEKKPEELEAFRQLEEAGKQLIEVVDLSKYAPGTTAYSNFGSVKIGEEISPVFKMIMFITFHVHLKQSGIRWVIGRVSNSRAMDLQRRIGAVVLKETVFQKNGKKFPLFFYELDLNSNIFVECESSLPKLKEKEASKTPKS